MTSIGSETRPCTCHPDDKVTIGCMRKYAATDCSISRAYQIADESMFCMFLDHTDEDPETGYRIRTDEAANKAARWLICRGMAKSHAGLIEIVRWADVEIE